MRDAYIRTQVDNLLLRAAEVDRQVEDLVRQAHEVTVEFESRLTPGEDYDRERAEDAGITALADALAAILCRIEALGWGSPTLQGLDEIRARGFTGVGITEDLPR